MALAVVVVFVVVVDVVDDAVAVPDEAATHCKNTSLDNQQCCNAATQPFVREGW